MMGTGLVLELGPSTIVWTMSKLTRISNYTSSKKPPREPASERTPGALLEQARGVFRAQSELVADLGNRVGDSFMGAVHAILESPGHVVVSGVGKSGIIGQKVAATLSSTGTASFFLHPTEALHGDLGRVARSDVALLISNSGETEEVMRLVPHLRALGLPLIGLLGNQNSALWEEVDFPLDVSVSREACPHNLAPTTSILATVAMSDALAVSLMKARDFRAEDFARSHPGGALGQRFAAEVRSVMRTDSLPLLTPEQDLRSALPVISNARLGMGVVAYPAQNGEKPRPLGLLTDGDVRRALERGPSALDRPVREFMGEHPLTVTPNSTIEEAQNRMRSLRVKGLLVVDADRRLLGVVDIFGI
jgi:arabinose-5-phosphate isomerase